MEDGTSIKLLPKLQSYNECWCVCNNTDTRIQQTFNACIEREKYRFSHSPNNSRLIAGNLGQEGSVRNYDNCTREFRKKRGAPFFERKIIMQLLLRTTSMHFGRFFPSTLMRQIMLAIVENFVQYREPVH